MTQIGSHSNPDNLSWQGRSVFITGAAGFVGRWLSEKLVSQGARVIALDWQGKSDTTGLPLLDSKGFESIQGRVENSEKIERILHDAYVDTVFHLAAINVNIGTSVSPRSIFETNIRGTWSVLEACRLVPSVARIVLASSSEAEDEQKTETIKASTKIRRKRHPYQVSKISAELVAQAYADTYGMPIAISRSDNIYGGRDLNWNRLIPGVMRSLINGEAPVLRSDGTLARDFIYIDDIVAAYLTLAEKTGDSGVRGEIFHFATGTNTTALDIVTQLCELTGRSDLKPVVLNKSPCERINSIRPINLERDLLGWASKIDLREGLQLTANWYKKYFHESGHNPEY